MRAVAATIVAHKRVCAGCERDIYDWEFFGEEVCRRCDTQMLTEADLAEMPRSQTRVIDFAGGAA